MKKYLILILILVAISFEGVSQIKDNQFIFYPRLGITRSFSRFHLPLQMQQNGNDIEVKEAHAGSFWKALIDENAPKYEFGDWYVGLKVLLIRPRSHFGGFFYLDYKNKQFKMKYPSEEYKKHVAHAIAPALGLRINTGNFTQTFHWVLDIGCAYNFNFQYKGSYDNKLDIINNGFSGILGVGFEFMSGRRNENTNNKTEIATANQYFSMTLQYSKDLYNFFNSEFSPDGIIYPYKGFKNNFGYIGFTITIRGSFQGIYRT